MNETSWYTRVMRWLFYLLFALVPVILTPFNYELFEFNKMIVTYIITTAIVVLWIIKMIAEREIRITKTPLDIPIGLFVTSQVVSTVFSIDPHVSWFGYYSRFNGGLWSIFSYVILYYAFVSTMVSPASATQNETDLKVSKKAKPTITQIITKGDIFPFLRVSLFTAVVVALYGVAERLGIDKHLWVQDVQTRVFSTLGQPNWLAAYLVALIPISIVFALKYPPLTKDHKLTATPTLLKHVFWAVTTILFFLVLLFTRSRSGLLGLAVADAALWVLLYFKTRDKTELLPTFVILHAAFALIIFINGSNIAELDKYVSFSTIRDELSHHQTVQPQAPTQGGYVAPALESGGTESGTIRKYVWEAAVYAWESTTKTWLIGTGTETFTFAFYRFRPAGHNMTSEWDFLYNKAHNEYLNYLATTGTFGLVSYLLVLGTFIFWFGKKTHSKWTEISGDQRLRLTGDDSNVNIALFAGWISILITNFFGFSVVIIQLFLFLFPAFSFAISANATAGFYRKNLKQDIPDIVLTVGFATVGAVVIALIATLWYADTLYAKSYQLARVGQYTQAELFIEKATFLNPQESIYHDEMTSTLTALAMASFEQQDATIGGQLANRAIAQSDQSIQMSPENVNFWKTRTKLFYTLSAYDPKLNSEAIKALEQALVLSPNDPKIYYNLAILYGRQSENDKAVELLKKAVDEKRDYRDAYYALYVFDLEMKKPDEGKAILQDYLQHINPGDTQFLQLLGKTK